MTTPTTTTFGWNKHDWASLSEMADGFDEYRLACSRTLDGQEITVRCRYVDSAEEFTLIQTFRDDELDWTIDGAAGAHSGPETYELFEMQPGLFYLHYQRNAETHPVVDVRQCGCVLVLGHHARCAPEGTRHRRVDHFDRRLGMLAGNQVDRRECVGA